MIQKQVSGGLAEQILEGKLVTGDSAILNVSSDGGSLIVDKKY
jgi:hypothetical protein